MNILLYACSAGVLSTFNPCAYTLLPAILSRFLAKGRGGVVAGLKLGAVLTLGTLTAFGALGLLVALVGTVLGRFFPYLALVLAGAFLLLGALSLSGRKLELRLGFLSPKKAGFGEFYLFGVVFGLASLGCTLPIFLTVAGLSLAQGPGTGFLALLLYGLSMGGVLAALSLATALGKQALLLRARLLGRFIEPLGGALLLAAGGYLLYTNLGYLTFNYTLGWWLGVTGSVLFFVLGLGLRYLGRGVSASWDR